MDKSNVWKAVGVVVALFFVMLGISLLAPDNAKVADALVWTKTLVGIFVTVAGVGSSAISLTDSKPEKWLVGVGPGVVGVFAGSTLLGVGGWAAPAALGVMGVGVGIGYALK